MACIYGDKDHCLSPWQAQTCAEDRIKDTLIPPVPLVGPINPTENAITMTWDGLLATDYIEMLLVRKNSHDPIQLDTVADDDVGEVVLHAMSVSIDVAEQYNFLVRRVRDGVAGKFQRYVIVYYGVDITYLIDTDSAYLTDNVDEDFIADS
jgi:hypothetical protein